MVTIVAFLAAVYAIFRCFVWMIETLTFILITISVVLLVYLIVWKIKGGDKDEED